MTTPISSAINGGAPMTAPNTTVRGRWIEPSTCVCRHPLHLHADRAVHPACTYYRTQTRTRVDVYGVPREYETFESCACPGYQPSYPPDYLRAA
jgi:hypothetical protein